MPLNTDEIVFTKAMQQLTKRIESGEVKCTCATEQSDLESAHEEGCNIVAEIYSTMSDFGFDKEETDEFFTGFGDEDDDESE